MNALCSDRSLPQMHLPPSGDKWVTRLPWNIGIQEWSALFEIVTILCILNTGPKEGHFCLFVFLLSHSWGNMFIYTHLCNFFPSSLGSIFVSSNAIHTNYSWSCRDNGSSWKPMSVMALSRFRQQWPATLHSILWLPDTTSTLHTLVPVAYIQAALIVV